MSGSMTRNADSMGNDTTPGSHIASSGANTALNAGSTSISAGAPSIMTLGAPLVAALLPFPKTDANKYTRGKLTIIGGCSAYPGAVCLAATAGEVMGAGYVEVVTAPESLPIVHASRHSIVAKSWDGFDIAASSIAGPKEGNPQACLIGSGFDAAQAIEKRLFFDLMAAARVPLVIDGGAITYLASEEGIEALWNRNPDIPLVLTPHGGEAARLARAVGIVAPKAEDAMVQKDHDEESHKLASYAQALARAYHATVILKGPDTYIASFDPDLDGSQVVFLMDRGTAVLAKAGTGDVLAGLVASLLAQGLCPQDAACVSTYLHAEAGRCAARALTEICVCAEDIICFLSEAVLTIAALH